MSAVTVTGPFEATAKADKPCWGVVVKQGEYISHHYFEAQDATVTGKAQGLRNAEAFAAAAREEA